MKKSLVRLFSAAIAALVLAGSLAACSGSKDSSNQLRVGMEGAYAPFNWTQMDDSNGAVKIADGSYVGGYDVEIAKRIAESLGKELVIVKTEWDGLAPGLTSGKLDLVIAGMSATAERRQTIDFSDNYYTSDLVVVVRKDGPFAAATSLDDFSGAKITGQLNTLHYDVIDQIPNVDKQQAMKDFPTMIVALSSGKIDGYVSERPGALSAVAANGDLTFIEFPKGQGFDFSGDEVSIAIGLAKNSPLLDPVNQALAKISEEERAKLMDEAVRNQPLAQ